MGILDKIGRTISDGDEGQFFSSLAVTALAVFGLQGAIDDNDWDKGTENSSQAVQELRQGIDNMTELNDAHLAKLKAIDDKQFAMDEVKRLDELKTGDNWSSSDERYKTYEFDTKMLKEDKTTLSNEHLKNMGPVSDAFWVDLLTNTDISEKQYVDASDAFDDKADGIQLPLANISNYGVMLRECQADTLSDEFMTRAQQADEIETCMTWEGAKDVLDWGLIIPLMFLSFPALGAAGSGLQNLERRRKEPKKKPPKHN